jgi:hypothetical protein
VSLCMQRFGVAVSCACVRRCVRARGCRFVASGRASQRFTSHTTAAAATAAAAVYNDMSLCVCSYCYCALQCTVTTVCVACALVSLAALEDISKRIYTHTLLHTDSCALLLRSYVMHTHTHTHVLLCFALCRLFGTESNTMQSVCNLESTTNQRK